MLSEVVERNSWRRWDSEIECRLIRLETDKTATGLEIGDLRYDLS
jgi:ribosomal protein S12 methylthiotransferase accessory factor YcaO